jgi:hypothetical protein
MAWFHVTLASIVHAGVQQFFYTRAFLPQQNHQQSAAQEKTLTQKTKPPQQRDDGKGTTMVHCRPRNGFHGHKVMESTNN